MNQKNQVLDTHSISLDLPQNKKYLSGNVISRHLIAGFMRTLLELVGPITPDRVLETGCGEGMILRQLQVLWPVAEFWGIDIEPELLLVGQKLVPQAIFSEASIYALPYQTDQFDLVVCTEVMEHLTQPAQALTELARVGRGYVLLSVPHEPWWRIANMARGRYLSYWGNTPGHLNHWSGQAFVRLVATRFEVVQVRHPFPWTMLLARNRRTLHAD